MLELCTRLILRVPSASLRRGLFFIPSSFLEPAGHQTPFPFFFSFPTGSRFVQYHTFQLRSLCAVGLHFTALYSIPRRTPFAEAFLGTTFGTRTSPNCILTHPSVQLSSFRRVSGSCLSDSAVFFFARCTFPSRGSLWTHLCCSSASTSLLATNPSPHFDNLRGHIFRCLR